MFHTGIFYLDLIIFCLCGAFTVYLILKDAIKKASPTDRFVYWLFVFGSWASVFLFVLFYLIGFVIGFVKQIRIELRKE